jgi:hypothetical protein
MMPTKIAVEPLQRSHKILIMDFTVARRRLRGAVIRFWTSKHLM